VGKLRFDPMAMLPFCGYHMGDYFGHWLGLAGREGAQLPKIFHVNWFRKDSDGKFLWPGYGENSRVLAWIFRRCDGRAQAVETPIGLVPAVGEGGIETEGLDTTEEQMHKLLSVDPAEWREQLEGIEEHYAKFGDRLPQALREQLEQLTRRLES
jgi:phosphoenolpyruvate carboxykinase (GTP)